MTAGAAILAASASAAAPTTAANVSPAVAHNVQCLLAMGAVSQSPSVDENGKDQALRASMFFAGEVFGGDPDIDLTAAARAEAPKLDDSTIASLQAQCVEELKKRGAQISAAGDALEQDSVPKK
ncbi:MAG TPA: hypothetical protein VFL92_07475 [Sphingomonas sp.]|nr:hypothetical protein [Sphingomonas sp.]